MDAPRELLLAGLIVRKHRRPIGMAALDGVGLIGFPKLLRSRVCVEAKLAVDDFPIVEAMFQLGIVLVALGFLVPLLRYRLYDAETVITRSAGFAVLTAALVAVFAGSEALIESLGQQYLGSGIGRVSGAAAAGLAAMLFTPLNERISEWAERRFQRDLVELKKSFPSC